MKRVIMLMDTIRPLRYGVSYKVSTRSIVNDKSGPTFFEIIDKWFSPSIPEVKSEPSSIFFAFHELTGMEGWCVLLCAGAMTRLATLYFSLYGERAAIRMQLLALPELKPAYDNFQRIYNSARFKAADVHIESLKLQSLKKEVFIKHQTSNVKTMTGLLGAPVVFLGLKEASKACNPTFLSSSSALHFVCGAPDPLFILPVITCGITLLNFEMTLRNREDLKQGSWMKNICWMARGATLIGIPLTGGLNAGVLLYWLGMSIVGILQPLLFRTPKFLSLFKVPVIPSPVKHRNDDKIDSLQMRFGVQYPFLNKMMNTGTEENLDLILKSSRNSITSLNKSSEVRPHNYAPTSIGHRRIFNQKPSESGEEGHIRSLADIACVNEDSTTKDKSTNGLRIGPTRLVGKEGISPKTTQRKS